MWVCQKPDCVPEQSLHPVCCVDPAAADPHHRKSRRQESSSLVEFCVTRAHGSHFSLHGMHICPADCR